MNSRAQRFRPAILPAVYAPGSQGDVWDAQKNILMDTLGVLAASLLYFAVRRGGAMVVA